MSISYNETKGFLTVAFYDYVAARTLLRNGMMQAAVGLASSSIEKYLKLHAIFKGQPLGKMHLGDNLINTLKNGVGFPSFVNEGFLRFLGQCYRLRYFDEIDAPYNLVVCRSQVLAELDEVVGTFEKGIKLTNQENGTVVATRYQLAVADNDSNVIADNYWLAGSDKSNFIEQQEYVYEIRFFGVMNYVEIFYTTEKGVNDRNFLRTGINPKAGDDRSFDLAFTPMQNSDTVSVTGLQAKNTGSPEAEN